VQKDSAQMKISSKVVGGGLLFLTHRVYSMIMAVDAFCYSSLFIPDGVMFYSWWFFLSFAMCMSFEVPRLWNFATWSETAWVWGEGGRSTTLCSEKKHPLTFSVISPWNIFRFTQNFQGMFMRNYVFYEHKN